MKSKLVRAIASLIFECGGFIRWCRNVASCLISTKLDIDVYDILTLK